MSDEPQPEISSPDPHPTSASAAPSPPPTRHTASTRVLVALSLIGALVFASSFAVVLYLVAWEDLGEVTEGSFLELKLTGQIQDAPASGGMFLEPDDFPPVVTEIASAVRRAAEDERIEGVYLRLEGTSLGWAGNQEIRSALGALREAGKPCVAYAEMYSTASYHLASVCDHVVLAPSGVGMVIGVAASTTYYAGTLEKLGVEAEMEHVGDFKTAVEPYERTEPSEAATLAMDALLDSLWGQWVAEVAEGREVEADTVQAWVDEPSISPQRALERGMVDALAFPDQVRRRVTRATEDDWLALLEEPLEERQRGEKAKDKAKKRLTPLKEYLKDLRGEWSSASSQIAVVHAAGAIVSGEAEGGLFGGQTIADKTFAKWMAEIRGDDDVAGVVLRIDSPGGSGLASDMIWREIERTRATGRPVVVSMANAAASGGYYMSAPADWIVAQPATITGSIGVFGGKMNLSGTYEKLGLTQATFKRGEQADLFSPTSGFDEAGRQVYRTFLLDFYERFLQRVADGRGMTRDEVHEVAQGRVWTGEQALERGLVDELGGLEVAIAKAEALAEVEGAGVVRWPKRKGFVELLLEDLEGGSAEISLELYPGVDTSQVQQLLLLEKILSGGGVAALLPGALRLGD